MFQFDFSLSLSSLALLRPLLTRTSSVVSFGREFVTLPKTLSLLQHALALLLELLCAYSCHVDAFELTGNTIQPH